MTENKSASQNSKGFLPVNGIDMYYEMYGSGRPLVLLHGGGSTIHTTFGSIIPFLSASFRLIGVELQGHGHTGDRSAPVSFEQDADDVAALLAALGMESACIIGFSNGGNTAMQLAIRHPQKVEKLVLASTFYQKEGFPPGFFEGMQKATLDVMPTALADAFLHINPDREKLQNMFEKDRQRMLQFEDWSDDVLRSIPVPVLVISGDQNVILPVHTLKMTALLPHARLLILPATHGSYMGVAESAPPSGRMTEWTAGVISHFLENE